MARGFNIPIHKVYSARVYTVYRSMTILPKELGLNHEPFIFLTPKQDVLYIYEDFTLRQTLEKWSNQRYATIPVLKRNGEYVGSITEGDILWGHEKSARAGP